MRNWSVHVSNKNFSSILNKFVLPAAKVASFSHLCHFYLSKWNKILIKIVESVYILGYLRRSAFLVHSESIDSLTSAVHHHVPLSYSDQYIHFQEYLLPSMSIKCGRKIRVIDLKKMKLYLNSLLTVFLRFGNGLTSKSFTKKKKKKCYKNSPFSLPSNSSSEFPTP